MADPDVRGMGGFVVNWGWGLFLIGGKLFLIGGEVVLNWGVFPSMTTCSLPPTAKDIAPATPPLTEPVPDVGEAQTFDAQVQPPVPPLAEEMVPAASLLTWKKLKTSWHAAFSSACCPQLSYNSDFVSCAGRSACVCA